jgi:D-glycero-D-manno-heptose 1,7-bisphosphate phosphatase
MGDRKAVFLDRDGTLMEEVHYCNDPARVRAIPGAAASLDLLRRAGWLAVVVTNQSGLATGRITPAQYEAVNSEFLRQMNGRIDAVYHCDDHPGRPTARRKPGSGMIDEAAADLGIDPSKSWMVGDKEVDVGCGRGAGCRTILVRTGHGAAVADPSADVVAADIVEAVHVILALCRR